MGGVGDLRQQSAEAAVHGDVCVPAHLAPIGVVCPCGHAAILIGEIHHAAKAVGVDVGHKERDIWTAETLSKAMEVCDDPILSLALNLAFSCSLRIGEMLGLTWDCIDIAPQSIENGSAYIFVNKELQRVTRGALDDLSDKGVIKKFPPCIASTHTALVLKEPKTKTSIRRVYLPKTVAYMLVERKKEIDELMDLFGDECQDP